MTKKDIVYDFFISYRRDGAIETAQIIANRLEDRGYTVFLDTETLKHGDFEDKIINAIIHSKNFLPILSEGCFDRCQNEKDWFRREIEKAFNYDCIVVPVFKSKFMMPMAEELPETIAKIVKMNGVEYNPQEPKESIVNKILNIITDDSSKNILNISIFFLNLFKKKQISAIEYEEATTLLSKKVYSLNSNDQKKWNLYSALFQGSLTMDEFKNEIHTVKSTKSVKQIFFGNNTAKGSEKSSGQNPQNETQTSEITTEKRDPCTTSSGKPFFNKITKFLKSNFHPVRYPSEDDYEAYIGKLVSLGIDNYDKNGDVTIDPAMEELAMSSVNRSINYKAFYYLLFILMNGIVCVAFLSLYIASLFINNYEIGKSYYIIYIIWTLILTNIYVFKLPRTYFKYYKEFGIVLFGLSIEFKNIFEFLYWVLIGTSIGTMLYVGYLFSK